MTMAVSNPSQAGVTELGANADYYVQFDVAIGGGATSPVYWMKYEIDLWTE